MGTLYKGAKNAVEVCMEVKSDEHVLIVTDKSQYEVGRTLRKAAFEVTPYVSMLTLEAFGERPMTVLPKQIEELVPKMDVTFWAAESKKGELEMRRPFIQLAKKYARHGHMPGVTKKLMEQGMCSDYERIYRFTNNLHKFVKNARTIEITNPAGTDLKISLNPEWRWKPCTGIYHKKGEWGNLPEGELYTAALNVDGTLVVDELGDWFSEKYGALTPPENKANTPVFMSIRGSRVDLRTLKCSNKELEKELIEYLMTDENSNKVGEVSLPTNLELMKKPLIGNLLQDEKARVHIAFGNPYSDETGADWESKTHVDCLIKQCTVFIDGKKRIIENDRYRHFIP